MVERRQKRLRHRGFAGADEEAAEQAAEAFIAFRSMARGGVRAGALDRWAKLVNKTYHCSRPIQNTSLIHVRQAAHPKTGEDFPHSHNLVLIGQPPLLQSLALSINEEIRSRMTCSVVLPRLAPKTIEALILGQLDRADLEHHTFSSEALALIVRSGDGLLRRTRNLCLGSLIEAVRDQTRVVDRKQVNRVLIQPHWRKDCDQPLI